MIGRTLTHYRVTARLGEGGMGEVYRATDTRLGREVAIKVLPGSFSCDPQSLARFEREARALAALNHPHIATIYGFDADQDTHFLVLELVEGETLSERLRRGPLPLKEALAVARQIAEAIQEAHDKGIIHRDLKPGNVKIAPNGRVKVLDFGLAKMEQSVRREVAPTPATVADQVRLSQSESFNSSVVEAYLRGRFQLSRGTKEGFEQALAWFHEALRLDPRFAKAYSGIADAYVLAGGWWVEDAVVLSEGLKAATNAVALDPGAAEPQASLGWLYNMSWRWADAEEAFKAALRLNPRYAKTYEGYGWLQLYTGRREEGLKLLMRCQELEPADPVFASTVAWACIHLGEYDRAASYLDKAFQLDPNFWLAQGLRGLLFAFQGKYDEAMLWAEKAVQTSGRNDEMLGNLGWIYGKAGESAKAQAILNELLTTTEPIPSSRQDVSCVYLGMNQTDRAIEQLQEGLRIHDTGLMFLRFDRRFDPLRQDARFKEILKTIGLDH